MTRNRKSPDPGGIAAVEIGRRAERSLGALGDRGAILLSGLCLAHCLALPLLSALVPWMAVWAGEESQVHRWLLLLIVPISLLALADGCRKHRDWRAMPVGLLALALLALAATLGHGGIFPWSETGLTVLGSLALSASHLINLRALHRITGVAA